MTNFPFPLRDVQIFMEFIVVRRGEHANGVVLGEERES
jgi:hypothetical protein